jgi:uncharacterized protein YndB with AHSA1/START domain
MMEGIKMTKLLKGILPGVGGISVIFLILFCPMGWLIPQEKPNTHPAVSAEGGEKLFIPLATGLAIRKVVIVPASVDDVWQAWTTPEGVVTFFAPQARVELAVGGVYEMYFAPQSPEGLRGGEGCKILSFVPGEMLSFTWNAPPSLPEVRKEHTWVVLYFKALEPAKTQVSMVHLGWQMGEEWQKALQYFDRAWEVVLGRLQYRFQQGPLDWKKPFTPETKK